MTAFILKIIASACMLIDHIGAVFDTPYFFRLIGRIAFPIYAYMIAQGCKHTKNINKYLLRLGVFALISEIPFDIAFINIASRGTFSLNINFWDETNVFYTLFLAAACIVVYESIRNKMKSKLIFLPALLIPISLVLTIMLQDTIGWDIILAFGFLLYLAAFLWLIHYLPKRDDDSPSKILTNIFAIVSIIPVFTLGSIMDTDYGMWGIIFIFFIYLMKPENKLTSTIAMFIIVFIEYAYPFFYALFDEQGIHLFLLPGRSMSYVNNLDDFWFALISAILVFMYNRKQGVKLKWFFYAFYPAHIAVLAVVWVLLNGN